MTVYTYHTSDTENVGNSIFVFATAKIDYRTFGLTDFACRNYGAKLYRVNGFSQNELTTRSSYAIQVADEKKFALRTIDILRNIDQFLEYARVDKANKFHITDFTKQFTRAHPAIVARLFVGAHNNCIFPESWKEWIEPPVIPGY
jgi:hypothetical protein